MKIATLLAIAAGTLAVCSLPLAWGSADLNVYVAPGRGEPYFTATYQRTVVVEYGEGGELADLLEGAVGTIEAVAQGGGPDAEALRAALNENIKASGSGASIRSLDAHYKATLKGNPIDAVISYEVRLSGTLGGHTIAEAASDQPVVVDMAWRDITARDPVTVQGVEINLPRGAFGALAPEVLAALPDEAAALLDKPLIMATSIHETPLETWQSFFGSRGIAHIERFEPFEEISGPVVSDYVLGKNDLGEGIKTEIVEEVHFSLDRPYALRTLESADAAYVRVLGFAKAESYGEVEVVRIWSAAPEGLWPWFISDPLQVMIIYGIAGIGAGGGSAFLAFSRRALKREERMGQRGTGAFPPAGYRAGAGGYAQRSVVYSEPPSPAPSGDAAYPRRAVSPTVASPGVRIRKLGNLRLATGVAAGIAGVIFAVGILLQNPEIFAFGLILAFALLIAQLVISRVEKGELMKQMEVAVEKVIAAGIERGTKATVEQKMPPAVASSGVRIWKLGNLRHATGVAAGIAGVAAIAGILSRNPEAFGFGSLLAFALLIAQLVISRVEKGDLMRQMGAAVEKGIAAGIERGTKATVEQKMPPAVTSPDVRIWKLGNIGLATEVATGIAGVIFAVGILLQNPEIFGFGLILAFALLIAHLVISGVEKGELMKQIGTAVEKGIAMGIEKRTEVVIEQKEDKDLNPSVTDPLERPASRSSNTSRAPASHREPYGHPQDQTES